MCTTSGAPRVSCTRLSRMSASSASPPNEQFYECVRAECSHWRRHLGFVTSKTKKTRTLRFKFLDCSRECARDHMSAARKASGALWGRAFLAVWVHVSPERFSLHHALACSSLGLLERILFVLRRQGDRRQARTAAATACVSFAGLTSMLVSCGWRSLWYRFRLR